MFVDTHCHLFLDNLLPEIDDIIKRATDNGVDYFLIPSTDIASAYKVVELCEKYKNVYGAVGVHPQDSKDWNDEQLKIIDSLADYKKIVAIGEIGLDYYYDYSPKEIQKIALIEQIELAINKDLPVIIHDRDADADMMDIIRTYKERNLKAQFHCYNGSLEDALELISMRHYISFTGNITFKNADKLRNIVENVDIDKILIETDSPYMAPVPYRGMRNEPLYVKNVAEKLAEIKNLPLEEVGRITSFNAFLLFGIGSRPETCFTYKIHNSLYMNVTNRCNADCIFCDRKGDAALHGYNLKMNKSDEPSADVYIEGIGDPKKYDEIVFCGYGEPTIRWDVIKEVAKYVKDNGGSTRINTNGHGNVINKKDITPEFKDLIDAVSISLNSAYPEQYSKLMRVKQELYDEMLDFASKAKAFTKVTLTVVTLDEVEIGKAREIANSIGVSFRIRKLF